MLIGELQKALKNKLFESPLSELIKFESGGNILLAWILDPGIYLNLQTLVKNVIQILLKP